MAVLKKGSKGSAVKDLQAKLWYAGARPKLKDDGIFGPLTDKAVRTYQKKNGLKADGKVGKFTLATIKFGGKLPEMTVDDISPKMAFMAKARNHNKMAVNSYLKLEHEMAKLAQLAAREAPIAAGSVRHLQAYWDHLLELGDKIVRKQAEFKTIVNISPKKAEKLVKECEALEKEMNGVRSKMAPTQQTRKESLQMIRDKMDSTYKLYNDELKALSKNKDLILGRT